MQKEEKTNETQINKFTHQPEKAIVTRPHHRRKFSVHGNPTQYEEITPMGTKSMAVFTVFAKPGQSTGTKLLHHGGDETLLVFTGKFELELEDRKEQLGPGDSAFIPRGALHRLTNIGDEDGTGIFVLSPPEYTEGVH